MSATGLREFDTTVQQTHTWLNGIEQRMGHPDKRMAYHALRGVLHALRDRLQPAEVFDLSAQLPMLIRGIYFDGYRPSGKPEKFDKGEFLARVEKELDQTGGENPQKAVQAVLRVIAEHVSPGEAEQVRRMLPGDLRALWPAAGATT